jgi:hypothetical protein
MNGFSCNIDTLNNHHEAHLISWNLWTPIKLILVAENKMIDDFLSTLESNNSSLTNSKYPKSGQKIQNQIGLILALLAHI